MLHTIPAIDDECSRAALHAPGMMESLPEREFADLTHLAALICDTPLALVTLVDEARGWFKSSFGTETTETALTIAFCEHALLERDLFIVPDATQDERFAADPMVIAGPQWRFYAGVPIITEEGHALGTLCAVDSIPHYLSMRQEEALRILARQAAAHFRLRKSYVELSKLEALRDSLTHMIIHDLRQPLQSLIGGLQTLPILGELNAEQREFLVLASDGGQTLLGMINDLLDISKLESGLLELEYSAFEPMVLVSEALASVAQLAADKDLTLLQVIDADLPLPYGDQEKLRRTLVNLIGNAIKFTPQGGTITLSVRRGPDENTLLFSVADTGEGIPQEAFSRIFEKFGQLEKHKDEPKRGTGLGLTFCKMVVEAHGGSIWIESEVEKGSTFLFLIPVAPRTGEISPITASVPPTWSAE